MNASDPNGLFCWSPSCQIQDVAIGAAAVAVVAAGVVLAPGAAKVVDHCSGGRTPECVAAIKELGTDFAFGAVGKLLDSPLYEFFDALWTFKNTVAGESGIPC